MPMMLKRHFEGNVSTGRRQELFLELLESDVGPLTAATQGCP